MSYHLSTANCSCIYLLISVSSSQKKLRNVCRTQIVRNVRTEPKYRRLRKLYITYCTNISLTIIMNGTNKITYNVDCEGSIVDYTVETTSDAKNT